MTADENGLLLFQLHNRTNRKGLAQPRRLDLLVSTMANLEVTEVKVPSAG